MAILIPKSTFDDYLKRRCTLIADLAALAEAPSIEVQEFPQLGLQYIQQQLQDVDERFLSAIRPHNVKSTNIIDYDAFDSALGDLSGIYGILLLAADSPLLAPPFQTELARIAAETSSLFSILHFAPLSITPKSC